MPFGFPDIVGFYDMLYGTAGVDLGGLTVRQFGGASGIVFSGNPPYTVTDFIGMYPKFVGPATSFTAAVITTGSAVITQVSDVTELAAGQLIVSSSFPKDTVIISVGTGSITVSNNATVDGTTFTVYTAPFVPIVVLLTYVTLARASVMIARYAETWGFCMALFVAHYATLYMRTESGPNVTAGQVASSGLTKGILISRAAGDVSATSQLIAGYEQWGAWTETQYGEQFITIARAINMGPIWVQ